MRIDHLRLEADQTIADERNERGAHGHGPEGGLGSQLLQRLEHVGLLQLRRAWRVRVPSRRFLHREQQEERNEEAGRADRHEGDPPTFDMIPVSHLDRPVPSPPVEQLFQRRAIEAGGDRSAEEVGERTADGDAHGVDAKGIGPASRLVIIADDRVGRRRAARFADRDADARKQQEKEAGGKPAQRSHERPDRDAQRYDDHSVEPVRGHGERYAHKRIEEREGRPVEEAVFGVGEPEGVGDGLPDDGEQVPVNKVERVNQCEDDQDITAIRRRPEARPARGQIARWDRRCSAQLDLPVGD